MRWNFQGGQVVPSFTRMRRIRRPLALLVGLILLHLMAVESGFACAVPTAGDSGAAMAGMTDMPGMDMSGSPEKSTPDAPPCDFPWAPAGCQAMAPCAPAALTSCALAEDALSLARSGIDTRSELAPHSRTPAPEPPPPRA